MVEYRIETRKIKNFGIRSKIYCNGDQRSLDKFFNDSYKNLAKSQKEIIKSLHGIEKVVTTFNHKS